MTSLSLRCVDANGKVVKEIEARFHRADENELKFKSKTFTAGYGLNGKLGYIKFTDEEWDQTVRVEGFEKLASQLQTLQFDFPNLASIETWLNIDDFPKLQKLSVQSELKPPSALPEDLKATEHGELCKRYREIYAGNKGKQARETAAKALAEKQRLAAAAVAPAVVVKTNEFRGKLYGRCKQDACECEEYLRGTGATLCEACGHPPLRHAVL